MLAVKQAALNTINKLPEDADIDEIMYQLYVVDKIQKAQQAIEQQHVLSSEDLKREIDSW
jgi:5,10-methylene-tetrahydrofolate dehydrogenase/methenyl tetrahydrofolate cyclohydrolase